MLTDWLNSVAAVGSRLWDDSTKVLGATFGGDNFRFAEWLDTAAAIGEGAWHTAAEALENALAAIWLAFVVAALLAVLLHFGPIVLVWLVGAPHWVMVAMLLGLWPH